MGSVTRNRVLLAATVGAALAAGGSAQLTRRTVATHRGKPDPEARVLAEPARVDRVTPVTTSDGLALHVEEVGPLDAPLTVIFAHGWTCTEETWVYQRRELAGDDLRLVFYDQRGHGRSGRPADRPEAHSIDVLGEDLGRVLDVVAPAGPVVLVGHSMGGMTIMALADSRPSLFRPEGPVVGVALLGTSAGGVAAAALGLPVLAAKALRRFGPRGATTLAHYGDRLEGRRQPNAMTWALANRASFGGDVPPSLVELMERMIAQSPLATITSFFGALCTHDKLAALPALRQIPVLIMVGSKDVLTPVSNSQAMAAELPDAELVVLPGAGHMLMLERPALTSLHLRTLFGRAHALTRAA
jgi:pimeloyl-ACP methyl ester carboxylesterase